MVLRLRRLAGCSTLLAALLAVQGLDPGTAAALPTTVPPVVQRSPRVVTADALPTVQVDGVVWTQVMIGTTVYAAGEFTTARPAGAASGKDTSPRQNLLAYDITTGKLKPGFRPGALNGQVRALAVSPDRKTIYVGGDFTLVGSTPRARFAALDAGTGALRALAPAPNARVNAITVAGSSVYLGGWFTRVGAVPRSRLAAVDAATGTLTAWQPAASGSVNALVPTPDRKKIVVGGAFDRLNATTALGMGAVDAVTGQTRTWKVNTVVKDWGPNSAILSLAADADTVYGTGYAYRGGNYEGSFAVSPADGSIRWLQDCHGDSYGVAPVGDTVYVVGHAHHCSNIGGFPDTSPRKRWQRALAFTKAATGTVARNSQPGPNYGNFAGRPAPSLVNWFPDLTPGTFTGTTQAAWSVVGNATYVSAGGEFVAANGRAQQGLVRFAVPPAAPRKQGPRVRDRVASPALTSTGGPKVGVSWLTNHDRDDRALTYQVLRDGVQVHSVGASASFWDRRRLRWTDAKVSPGRSYGYAVRVRDRDGNTFTSATVRVRVAAPSSSSSATPAGPPPAAATAPR